MEVRTIRLDKPRNFLIKCMGQARKMGGDVYVCLAIDVASFCDFSIVFSDSVVYVSFNFSSVA